MKLMYMGKEIENIITNKRLAVEEALYVNGYDINDQEDLKKAYYDKKPWAYINDDGLYDWDFENLTLES